MNDVIRNRMLEKFDGCDGGDPGSPENPSIWLFGIEHGWPNTSSNEKDSSETEHDDSYSIQTQLKWPYNRNAFKLLAAIHGRPVNEYREFAHETSPFVSGSRGYFKGNLYSYPCHSVGEWPDDAASETGFSSKKSYQDWCNEYRLPTINRWINEYRPSLFIGVGNSFSNDFSKAVYGSESPLNEVRFSINSSVKKLFFGENKDKKLVIIPHLSGGRNGLNSNAAITKAGELIREYMAS